MHSSLGAIAYAVLAAAITAVPATFANAQDFHAKLSGLNVVDVPILAQGQATIALNLNRKLQSLKYTLTYSGLSANAFQVGIHFAKKRNNGGIVALLCSSGGFPPGTPTCPAAPSGTVSGLLTAGSVIGFAPSNVTAGDFNALADIILSKTAYVSIQTTNFPTGEIRGEIRRDDDENSQDD